MVWYLYYKNIKVPMLTIYVKTIWYLLQLYGNPSFFYPTLFYLCFTVWVVYIEIFSSSPCLSPFLLSLLMNQVKASFLIDCFWFLPMPFGSFLQFPYIVCNFLSVLKCFFAAFDILIKLKFFCLFFSDICEISVSVSHNGFVS